MNMQKIWLFLMLLLVAGCATTLEATNGPGDQHDGAADHPHFTRHYTTSLFKLTDAKGYSVELVNAAGEFKVGENSIDLIFHDNKDRDVTGAVVEVVPFMVLHGHGSPAVPTITERGGGAYTVNNLILSMAGPWELRVSIAKNGREEAAVFLMPVGLKVAAAGHPHKKIDYDKLDYATTMLSAKGSFKLTYIPEISAIKLNKIHSWRLKLETADGKPVVGAQIRVSGLMPEHGHGLPTVPQVTDDLGNGAYLCQGMKFNMPGVWRVFLEIYAGGVSDKVTFNLRI